MQLKFRVAVEPATISVESGDYAEDYAEYCESEGVEPEAEVPAEFVRAKVQEELDDGSRDLSEALEQVDVTVTLA